MVIYYDSAARDLGLMHHGIKGQKWGIRRYQNEDGTLTPAGRKRYLTSNGGLTRAGVAFLKSEAKKKTYNDYYGNVTRREARVAEELKAKGMTDLDANTMLLKKGSVVNRIAGDEGIDGRRKYVSITDDDKVYYEEDYHSLPIKGTPSQYEYELTKDAKVASYKNVIDHVMENYGHLTLSQLKNIGEHELGDAGNKQAVDRMMQQVKDIYGNTPVKELYKDYDLQKRIRSQVPTIDPKTHEWIEAPSPQWLKDRANIGHEAVRLLLNETLMNKNTSDKVFDKYKSDGYDLLVDVEDKISGFDMPMIVLDPSKTLKLKKKTPLKHEDTDMNIYYESSVTDPGLEHHGIKGMKWGIRRFQNPDGSLTAAGRRRYGTAEGLRAAYDEKIRRKTNRIRRRAESHRAYSEEAKKEAKRLAAEGDYYEEAAMLGDSKFFGKRAAKLFKNADDIEAEYKSWMADRDASQKARQKLQEERAKADAEQSAKEEADRKAEVDKAVASGDPAKIEKVMEKMTTQEIKDAIGRVQTMEDLRAKIPKSALRRGVNFMKDLAVDKIKTEITKKVMNLGNDQEDNLSKDEKDYRSRIKSILTEMSDADGKAQTKKDYSGALNKEVQEQEAKNVAKMIKDLEKAGIPHDQATKMGQQIMAKRMKDYEDSGSDVYSNQQAANENQNGDTGGGKKPSDGDSGGSKTGKDKPGKQEQSAPEQSTYDKALKEMKDAAAAIDKTPTPKTSFSRAWLSSTPSIKSADLTTSVKNIKVSSSANDLIQRYKSASFSSAKTAAEKINPFGSKTDSVKDTRPFTGNDNWKNYYKKTDSDKAWNDRYHPDQIKFNWHDNDNAPRSSGGSSSSSSGSSSKSTLDALKQLASSGSKAVNSNNLSKLDSYTLSLLRRKRR